MSDHGAKPKADGAESASTAKLERLAKQAGMVYEGWGPPADCWTVTQAEILAFAALVSAEEREACAKACRNFGKTLEVDVGDCFAEEIMACSNVELTGAPPTDATNGD